MNLLESLFLNPLAKAWTSFLHNWIYLAVGILSAVLMKALFEPQKLAGWFNRHRNSGILGVTFFAVGTPFCSCGTMAIVLGMLTGVMPWAPIVAFIVASPLTSPEGLFLSAGLFGWEFAIVFFGASIVLGLIGGAAARLLEERGWLKNQARFFPSAEKDAARAAEARPTAAGACACSDALAPAAPAKSACSCQAAAIAPMQTAGDCCAIAAVATRPQTMWHLPDLRALAKDVLDTSVHLVPMFLGFAWIGYFINGLIPAEWVQIVFGQGSHFGVPLAAFTGLPFYINAESSLPLVKTMIEAGMSKGAALAFLITGAGTSIGAITGLLTVARRRVVALVIGTYLAGAIILGAAYNLF